VYVDHIKRIHGLAARYGKRMMMWGDIILQHAELIPEIPPDIIMLDWGYSADADLSAERKFADAGLEHWTCPGVSTWGRIFAFFDNAAANIARRAVHGSEHGATGLLNTDWGDGGHPQMPSASYRGYAWGAEQSWTPAPRAERADFNRRFAWTWFDDPSGRFGKLYAEAEAATTVPLKRAYERCRCFQAYWHPFPIPDSVCEWATPANVKSMRRHVRNASRLASSLAADGAGHEYVLAEIRFGLRQVAFALRKVDLSRRVNRVRSEGRKPPPALTKAVLALMREWSQHRARFEELWLSKNRRSQIAFRLGLYDERAREYRRFLQRGSRPLPEAEREAGT
jgi:hypothetical protein